jgi:hypothetical protein
MEQYFAQITNGVVTNVVVATSEFMAANPERYTGEYIETFLDVPGKTYAGIGYLWNGTDFVLPPADETPIEP